MALKGLRARKVRRERNAARLLSPSVVWFATTVSDICEQMDDTYVVIIGLLFSL